MKQKPFRVTYHSLDDTWCRYFTSRITAIRYMLQKQQSGYTAYLTEVPEL